MCTSVSCTVPCDRCSCVVPTITALQIADMHVAVEATQQLDQLHDMKVPEYIGLQYLHAPRTSEELLVWTMKATLNEWRDMRHVEVLRRTLEWWLFNREVRERFEGKGLDSITVRDVLEKLHPCFARHMLIWAVNCEHLTGSEKMDALLTFKQLETLPATPTSLEREPAWKRTMQHGT